MSALTTSTDAMPNRRMYIQINALKEATGVGFGTSGARGLVEKMTDRTCYLYTVAFLQYLQKAGKLAPGCEVAIAGDLRSSTPGILSAVIRAVESQECQPLYCGSIATPAVALLGLERSIPSIMVTGSHIPDDRNGIKFNTAEGEILKQDEMGILEQQVALAEDLFDEHGRFHKQQSLPRANPVGRDHYLGRYLQFFPRKLFAGLRIGVYQHSSVVRDLMPEVLENLGATVIRLGHSDHFVPVDTEAIRPEDITLARQWVAEYQLDSLVSTDGDGDRPLVSDEHGEWLRGDIAGILTARFLHAACVVTPVSSNSAVERSGWFKQVIRTRIGSPYVIEGMQQAMRKQPSGVCGYEANGGFLQATPVERYTQTLSPLPTRDALIVIISILAMSREQGAPVSRLAAQLPARFTYSDRIKEFPPELSRKKIGQLASGNISADASAFTRLFGSSFGEIANIDYTDGVRFTLDSSDVIHLRPSGNAPELRCYTEAASTEHAQQLNQSCIAVMRSWS